MPPSLNANKAFEEIKKLVAGNLVYVEDLFAGDHNAYGIMRIDKPPDGTGGRRDPKKQVHKPQQQKEQYIRIFKDSTPEELWRSYCRGMGLNADDPDLVSFRITVHSSEDIHPERGEDLQ